MLLKPTRGLRLNKSHTLARGLVGCWLMNEGAGGQVFDLSGNGGTGTITGATWVPGEFGPALSFNGDGDFVDCGNKTILDFTTNFTISIYINTTIPGWGQTIISKGGSSTTNYFVDIDVNGKLRFLGYSANVLKGIVSSNKVITDGISHHIVGTFNGEKWILYIDGCVDTILVQSATLTQTTDSLRIGSRQNSLYFDGSLDMPLLFNRALSSSEVALLYREPFCVFENPIRPELIGSQIVNLVGTTVALSSLSATAKTMRKVVGNVTSISDVEALLNSIRDRLETERNWLREALFNGMTANAFKLGTTLSLGWFWVRIGGCSVLYRGSGMGKIDFVNILAVAESEACEISPPSYISHNSNSTYFYVIRRFNSCGYQEDTLFAAVKVSIDSNGNLAVPQPNNIFSSKVEQVNANKIQLVWFYCPLEQQSQPVSFNVYYDDQSGQIDYQNPLATIGYKGRKFYSHQTNALEAGKYLFAIRPEDANDIENSSLARLRIQLDTTSLDAIDILRAEAF